MTRIGLVCCLLLTSCQLQTLRPDFNPSNTRYQAAEIISEDGKRSIGLAAYPIPPLKPVIFSVRGIGSGYVRIHSEACDIEESKTYTNFDLVEFSVFTESSKCLIDVHVEPQFTVSQSRGYAWKGVSGVVLLKRSKNPVTFITKQIAIERTISIPLALKEKSQRVFISGCGFKFDHKLAMSSLNLRVAVEDNDSLCVIEGFIDGKIHQEITVLVNQYDGAVYEPIPIPEILTGSVFGTFYVTADESVAVMNYGHQTKFTNVAKFDIEHSSDYSLRLYTVGGRYEVCDFVEGLPKCFR